MLFFVSWVICVLEGGKQILILNESLLHYFAMLQTVYHALCIGDICRSQSQQVDIFRKVTGIFAIFQPDQLVFFVLQNNIKACSFGEWTETYLHVSILLYIPDNTYVVSSCLLDLLDFVRLVLSLCESFFTNWFCLFMKVSSQTDFVFV